LFAGLAGLLATIFEYIKVLQAEIGQGDRPVYLKKAKPPDGSFVSHQVPMRARVKLGRNIGAAFAASVPDEPIF